jgi:hypothetical protein
VNGTRVCAECTFKEDYVAFPVGGARKTYGIWLFGRNSSHRPFSVYSARYYLILRSCVRLFLIALT